MLYSASARGFFRPEIHGDQIPSDAVTITADEYAALISAQAAGAEIQPDAAGRPVAAPPQAPSAAEALAAARAALVLTDIQFALVAAEDGWMSAAEAEAWVGRGEIPAIGLAALAVLPEAERSLARIRFAGARTIARLDPFVPALIAAAGASDAQADDIWRRGMQL